MSEGEGGEVLGRQGKGEASSPPYLLQKHNFRLLKTQEFHQRMRSQRQGIQEALILSSLSKEVNCTLVFFKAASGGGHHLIDNDSAK